MEEKECEKLIKARDEIDNHIRAYEKRMNVGYDEERQRRDAERVELFKLIRKEFAVIIPNSTVFSDGKYFCPSCKANVGAIYAAADDAGFPVNFCPCCSQAFNGRIDWE